MARTQPGRRARAAEVRERLARAYPGTNRELCALAHDGPFQLLVATILSAQCTDARVNVTTPEVFRAFPTPEALAGADSGILEEMIRATGFFRSKARNLIGMAGVLVERFGSTVPSAMEELVTLPGVGRKTANVVRSVEFDLPGLPVDTHVTRISRLLGLTSQTDPVRIERDLDSLVPPDERGVFSMRLILHGRAVCIARRPRCGACVLADVCPSSQAGVVPGPGGPGILRPGVARPRAGAAGARISRSRGHNPGRKKTAPPL